MVKPSPIRLFHGLVQNRMTKIAAGVLEGR
jgi:hypothetical protein